MQSSIAIREKLKTNNSSCDATTTRLQIWAIPSRYHFTIVSFCLSAYERLRFIESLNIPVNNRCQFEIINSILNLIYRKSSYGIQLQQLLDTKFKLSINRLRPIHDQGSLESKWDLAVKDGELCTIFWATISHGFASSAFREKILKQVTLYSYENCCKLSSEKSKSSMLEQEVSRTKGELTCLKTQHQKSVCRYCKHISSLKNDLELAEYEVNRLERHLSLFKHQNIGNT